MLSLKQFFKENKKHHVGTCVNSFDENGYDGNITTTKYGPSETVNLQRYHK